MCPFQSYSVLSISVSTKSSSISDAGNEATRKESKLYFSLRKQNTFLRTSLWNHRNVDGHVFGFIEWYTLGPIIWIIPKPFIPDGTKSKVDKLQTGYKLKMEKETSQSTAQQVSGEWSGMV